ncbi:hypothetical protein SOVF_053210 [Spinacia oleracea]|nr:hypothetical protein SOVF_053210 [Spinacia oleracea]
MANFFLLFVLLLSLFLPYTLSKSTYIVHVSKSHKPATFSSSSSKDWYTSILNSLSSATTTTTPSLLYSYTLSSTGFAAHLSTVEAAELHRHPAVLTIIPDKAHHIHTTRTPHFLGLKERSGLWPKSQYASDVIIGVLDTGIWPELPSFSDEGYDQVPATWKGSCEVGSDFPASSCNRKIIGARAFYQGYEAAKGPMNETKDSKSPRDTEGHGTHTASTAAGSVVPNAGLFDYARGEAWGMAIKARIAAYKICWSLGCFESDILAAIDQAIADGVHVISLSVGGKKVAPSYDKDNIAIGGLHAAQRGVLVSCSAGNSGPKPFTAVNIAPWILTVGASTIDREFSAVVELGDGRSFKGASLYAGEPLDDSVYLKLVNGADCGSRFCIAGELNSSRAAGKMVICDRGGANSRVAKDYAVKQAGGVGMILTNLAESGEELLANSHIIPATLVGQSAGDQIKDYVSSNTNPTATIKFKGTVISPSPSAPRLAAFSSRGPNSVTPEILKPDDIDASDYISFLCSVGYDSKKIAIFLKDPATIDCGAKNLSIPGNLNYPSFSVVFESGKTIVRYTRVVKNVGLSANAVYTVNVNAPTNVNVSVTPRKLIFSGKKRTLSYEIVFTSIRSDESVFGTSSFGSIEWSDGSHRVRSPI